MDKLTQYLDAHPHDELHPSEIAKLLKDLDEKSFNEAVQAISSSCSLTGKKKAWFTPYRYSG